MSQTRTAHPEKQLGGQEVGECWDGVSTGLAAQTRCSNWMWFSMPKQMWPSLSVLTLGQPGLPRASSFWSGNLLSLCCFQCDFLNDVFCDAPFFQHQLHWREPTSTNSPFPGRVFWLESLASKDRDAMVQPPQHNSFDPPVICSSHLPFSVPPKLLGSLQGQDYTCAHSYRNTYLIHKECMLIRARTNTHTLRIFCGTALRMEWMHYITQSLWHDITSPKVT